MSDNCSAPIASAGALFFCSKNAIRLASEPQENRRLELPPKDRTCSGLRLRADELARRLIS
ncbi:hypothetical protein GOC88_28190, partial [Sinorhizobium medicae]|nr:hypothetical protein [Sinorhizobium medicae]